MLRKNIDPGAKYGLLILIYFACSTSTSANVLQGQPEMQQAMDNMISHRLIIKKNTDIPNDDGAKHPNTLVSKTNGLLNEAEKFVNGVHPPKEKHWIEGVVQRMKALAETFENTEYNKLENPNNFYSVHNLPVPEDVPPQSNKLDASAVLKVNPFQIHNKMMLKYPMASPELISALPNNESPSSQQVMTKLTKSSNKASEDELVRELESLQQNPAPEDFPIASNLPQQLQAKKSSDSPVPSTHVDASNKNLILQPIENQRLGKTPQKETSSSAKQSDPVFTESNESKENIKSPSLNGPGGKPLMMDQELKNSNIYEMKISSQGKQNGENKRYKHGTHFRNMLQSSTDQVNQLSVSHDFGDPNPTTTSEKRYLFQAKSFPGFKRFNHNNGNPNQMNGPIRNPGQLHRRYENLKYKLSNRKKKYQNWSSNLRNKQYLKNKYGLYPYLHQWDFENSTFESPQLRKEYKNHQMDVQLSEEMKRQLRDGKIIVLSDSVVHSNFEPDKKPEKEEQNSYSLKSVNNTFNSKDTYN